MPAGMAAFDHGAAKLELPSTPSSTASTAQQEHSAVDLDTLALPVPNGDAPIADLKPVDNAGLGLARAIAVANALASELEGTGVKIGAASNSTAHSYFCLGLNITLCPLVIWGGQRSAEIDRMRADRID
jgi:hypothetical protein